MSAWKPGDVAMTRYGRAFYCGDDERGSWVFDYGSGGFCDNCSPAQQTDPRDARPLVVIDPDDTEAVERLTDAFTRHNYGDVEAMQAALREFANPTPPKPDEPKGLGAVVVAGDGRGWIHHGRGRWMRDDATVLGWADLDVLRVVSEGVIA